jgi:hypothetical protein
LNHPTGDVLARRLLAAGGQQQDLAAVDRVGLDGNERLIGAGCRIIDVGEGDKCVVAAGKEGCDRHGAQARH